MNDLSRQSFLGAASEAVLADTFVGIVGLCGGGSHIAQQLAHIGIGKFLLCDPDVVEASNLNRMVGATTKDASGVRFKADVIADRIRQINPAIELQTVVDRWQAAAGVLRGCTAIFGCVDSFAERAQLETMCRRFLIPYFDVGMDVTRLGEDHVISGQVIVSMPGYPCMRCMGFLTDELLTAEVQNYGAAGGRPQVVWPNGVLASTAVGSFIATLLPWQESMQVPLFMEYDGNRGHVLPSNRLKALDGKKCPHFDGNDDLGDPFYQKS